MDHLDLDGIFSSAASNWMLPAFDQQDGNFLSASRQMLEPIMEETSEDEENQNWSQYENVWSSESDTGSVIRIELHNDQDSISERDFACPAKRPRRDDLVALEDGVQLRKYQRNENYLTADNQENFRKRFDDFYSDSDSLSYNSLSRSSSLIQFESLERQLQSDHGSLGNSSPSLLSFDANNDAKGSNGCLRRFESSESRLHQTYFDLDKIDFENTLIFTEDRCNQHNKSDSESSDNSILSHEERILKPRSTTNSGDHRNCYKGKSSAENLSEDSGYCEHVSVLRIKSKSIPNFIKRTEKFCEEDEFDIHKSLEMIFTSGGANSSSGHEMPPLHSRGDKGGPQTFPSENKRISKTTKIAGRSMDLDDTKQQQRRVWYSGQDDVDEDDDGDVVKNKIGSSTKPSSTSRTSARSLPSSPTSSSSASSARSSPFAVASSWATENRTTASTTLQFVSSSLPDVRAETDSAIASSSSGKYLRSYDSSDRFNNYNDIDEGQFTTVSSVPKDLNLFATSNSPRPCADSDADELDNYSWSLRRHAKSSLSWSSSKAAENRPAIGGGSFSCSFLGSQSAKSLVKPAQNYMNASYNNLTLLDYSGRPRSNRNSLNMSEGGVNSKRNSREFELGKGNFLLDEISLHFDRNVSILNDREPDSDLVSKFLEEERDDGDDPPKPPTRRSNLHKEPRVTSAILKPLRQTLQEKSFDQDPTVLHTSYAESLEKCNFDPKELSNSDLRDLTTHSTPIKRGFVASTPNLNTFRDQQDEIEDDLHVSSAHTSMNPLPGEKKLGILMPEGCSRNSLGNSLGKGVSFCPVVSEISWREQSSEECVEPDSLENIVHTRPTAGNQLSGSIEAVARTTVEPVAATCGQQAREPSKPPKQAAAISDATAVKRGGAVGGADSSGQVARYSSSLSKISDDQKPKGAIMDQKSGTVISDSVNNNSKKMGGVTGVKSATMPTMQVTKTGSSVAPGTDPVSAKFKHKSDEKHHKHSFLSRFAGGFRFSWRKKKSQTGGGGMSSADAAAKGKGKKSVADGAVKSMNFQPTSSSQKSPDFIYIPLKGPVVRQQMEQAPCTGEQGERHLPSPGAIAGDNNHVLLGKPPLPKQPPRVVGVCEKMRGAGTPQQGGGGNGRHAPGLPRPSSQPREIDERFLDNERRYYTNGSSQLNGTMNGNGCSSSFSSSTAHPPTSKSTIRQQQPHPSSRCHHPNNNGNGAAPPKAGPNDHCKIGLIETNLDTHETVISGKTRSLMELGPQVRHTLSKQSACNDASDAAIIDGTSRRPHKSMEFLLDKENQKNVLVEYFQMLSPPLPPSCCCENKMVKMSRVQTSDFSEPDFSVFLESIEIAPRRKKVRKTTPLRRKAYYFNNGLESSIAETSLSTINDSIFKITNDVPPSNNFGNLFNYFSEDVEVIDYSDKELDKKVGETNKKLDEQTIFLQPPPRNSTCLEKKFNVEKPEKPKRIFNSTMNSSFAPVPETDQSFTSVKDRISFFNSIQVPKQSSKCQCSCRRRHQTKESDQSLNSSVKEKIHYFNEIGYTYKRSNGKVGYKKMRPRPRSKNFEEIFKRKNNSPRPRSKNFEEIVGENLNIDNKDQKLQAVEVSLNLLEFCLNQWKSELKQVEDDESANGVLEETALSNTSKNDIDQQPQKRHSTGEYSSQKIVVQCQINTPPKDDMMKKPLITDLDEIESVNRSQNIYEKVHSTEGNSDSGNYSSCRNISRRLNFERSSKRISVASYSSSGSSNKPFRGLKGQCPPHQYKVSRINTQTQTDASFALLPSPIGSPQTPKKNTKTTTIENTPMEFQTASEEFFGQYMSKYTPPNYSKKHNQSSFRASIKNLDEVKHLLENFKSKSDKEESKSSGAEGKKKKRKNKITSTLFRLVRHVFSRSKKDKSN